MKKWRNTSKLVVGTLAAVTLMTSFPGGQLAHATNVSTTVESKEIRNFSLETIKDANGNIVKITVSANNSNINSVFEEIKKLDIQGSFKELVINGSLSSEPRKSGNIGFEDFELDLSGNVQSIPENAFYFFSKTRSANFPNAKSIGKSSFVNVNLSNGVFFPKLEEIPYFAFFLSGLHTIDSAMFPNVLNIGSSAFADSKLTKAIFPNLETIDSNAFRYSNLEEITAPKLDRIETQSFGDTNSLNVVNFPNLTHIESIAFSRSSIKEINAPNLEYLTGDAFRYTTRLKEVAFPYLTDITSNAFEDSSIEIAYLDSLRDLPNQAFKGATKLKTTYLPSVTNIGEDAFAETKLTSLYLPKVEKIKAGAFNDSTIKTVTFPYNNRQNLKPVFDKNEQIMGVALNSYIQDQSIEAGSTVLIPLTEIYNQESSTSTISYEWFENNQLIGKTNDLTIPNFSKENQGVYQGRVMINSLPLVDVKTNAFNLKLK